MTSACRVNSKCLPWVHKACLGSICCITNSHKFSVSIDWSCSCICGLAGMWQMLPGPQLGLTTGCVLSPRSVPYVSAFLDHLLLRAYSWYGDKPGYKGGSPNLGSTRLALALFVSASIHRSKQVTWLNPKCRDRKVHSEGHSRSRVYNISSAVWPLQTSSSHLFSLAPLLQPPQTFWVSWTCLDFSPMVSVSLECSSLPVHQVKSISSFLNKQGLAVKIKGVLIFLSFPLHPCEW